MKKHILFSLCAGLFTIVQVSAQTKVANPRCENLTNPAGIETLQPRLSWQLQSTARNVFQSRYRIIVSDDSVQAALNTGNMWDTKEVNSDQSQWVPYGGKPLQSSKSYYWKVMVWDNQGGAPAWSEVG